MEIARSLLDLDGDFEISIGFGRIWMEILRSPLDLAENSRSPLDLDGDCTVFTGYRLI